MHDAEAATVDGGKKKSYLVTLMEEEIAISTTEDSSEDIEDNAKQGADLSKEDSLRYVVEDNLIKGPNIIPSTEEEKHLWRPWKRTLIIKLLGKRIGFGFLKKKIDAIWANKGITQLIDLGNEYFMAKFSAMEDYEFALTGGPWMVLCLGCQQQVETTNHLFFDCGCYSKVWMACFKWFDFSTVIQKSCQPQFIICRIAKL